MAALTAAALALTAANTATSFIGQQRAAKGAQAMGNYEAGIDEQDASIADTQALDALARGKEAERRQRTLTTQTIGAQRATMAASGIDLGAGSPADVQADTARIGVLDALTLANNAKREAWGFNVQAMDLRARAGLARAGGANTASSLRNQSYGTLLSGALQTYGLGQDLAGEMKASSYRKSLDTAAQFGRRYANTNGGAYGGGY